MTASEARKWLERYNKEEDLYNTGLEGELRKKFNKNGFMTKDDLLRIVEWKFQIMRGREQRIRNLLKAITDKDVQTISAAAFEVQDDELRFGLLMTIKGIGAAMASTILTFFDPDKYGIYDIHSWRGLMKSKEPKVAAFKDVKKFLTSLRQEVQKCHLSCRDMEKAYFKIDLDSKKLF